MKWTLEDVASFCSGRAVGAGIVTSVAIDSRSVEPGALFVAVAGENADGHDYLDDAVANGAAAVLVEMGRLDARAGVEVDHTIVALRTLAEHRRAELDCRVVAVTGSSGKTTTKDFIAGIAGGVVHASPRSYNNEFGVPLTVLGAPDDCDVLVAEVGSRGAGHIAALAPAVRPDVSVITNVGRAHLEMFGSVAGVADAKWELIEALQEGGIAVLPSAHPELVERADGQVVTFGEHPSSHVRIVNIALDDAGRARFGLVLDGERVDIALTVPGRHQPLNAAAAVAAAVAAGGDFVEVAPRLERAEISPWRMETSSIPWADGDITVVNDSYNANPDSMASALRTVAAMPGRHVAVLGKMHELGDFESAAHREAGELAAELDFFVIAVGEDPGFADGAGSAAVIVSDVKEAVERLGLLLEAGDTVLIKASRAAGLERIADELERGAA